MAGAHQGWRSCSGVGAQGLSPSLTGTWGEGWGMGRVGGESQQAPSPHQAQDQALCAHLQHRCSSLWDELTWGFDSESSRGDAQNKLKIACIDCCCFYQGRDVTRWAPLGLYIKPHCDVSLRHCIAPGGVKLSIGAEQVCEGCWGLWWHWEPFLT